MNACVRACVFMTIVSWLMFFHGDKTEQNELCNVNRFETIGLVDNKFLKQIYLKLVGAIV